MPAYRGSGPIPDIRRGSTLINEIRRGSTLLWSRALKGDDFNRDDADTLGPNWTYLTLVQGDYVLGVDNQMARVQLPDGLVGGVFSLRTSVARYTAQTALSDTGFIEVRAGSRGDSWSLASPSGYTSTVYGRANNQGSTLTNGAGIYLRAGSCGICYVGALDDCVEVLDCGGFQAGQVLRLAYSGTTYTLTVNGILRATWTDTGNKVSIGADYRTLAMRSQAAKDALGARRFAPRIDSAFMG